jgi:hypothetical protein
MATLYGKYATKRDVNLPADKIPGKDNGNSLKFYYDEFTLSAALSTNDIVNLFKLPAGGRVVDMGYDSPDLDSSTNAAITIGWAASADGVEAASSAGFFASQDVHTSGKTGLMSAALQSTVAGKLKEFASEVQVQVKVTAGGDATSGTIRVWALVARNS